MWIWHASTTYSEGGFGVVRVEVFRHELESEVVTVRPRGGAVHQDRDTEMWKLRGIITARRRGSLLRGLFGRLRGRLG